MSKVFRVLSTLIVVVVLAAACTPAAAPTQAPAETSPTTAPEQPAAPTEAAPAAEAPTEAPAPAAEPVVVNGQIGANDPRSIDPQRAVDTRDWGLVNQFFPSMAIQDLETGQLEPAMAESWEVSDDGMVFTFHM